MFVFALFTQVSLAQSDVEMADVMRSNGKIYVVVAVLVIIFIGLVVYLVSLDRKVSKLEKEIKK
jgi:CcmD family protein